MNVKSDCAKKMNLFGAVAVVVVSLAAAGMQKDAPPKRNGQSIPASDGSPVGKEPSLKETLDWLKDKIPLAATHYVVQLKGTLSANMGDTKDVTTRAVPIRFDSCSVAFESSEVDIWGNFPKNPVTTTTRYTVPLGEVSDITTLKADIFLGLSDKCIASKYSDCKDNPKIERWAVFLETKSGVILQETHEDLKNTTQGESSRRAFLDFSDEPLAKRVADAFTHASDLCRGKEPF